jgi:hypothetical protein
MRWHGFILLIILLLSSEVSAWDNTIKWVECGRTKVTI